jgi:hypothetical protein
MNLIGPELVRDLVSLLGTLESGAGARVMVLESADPEYFIPHVDLTKVAEYTAEAAKAGGPGDASLGMLWHKLSELPVVTRRQTSPPFRFTTLRRGNARRRQHHPPVHGRFPGGGAHRPAPARNRDQVAGARDGQRRLARRAAGDDAGPRRVLGGGL